VVTKPGSKDVTERMVTELAWGRSTGTIRTSEKPCARIFCTLLSRAVPDDQERRGYAYLRYGTGTRARSLIQLRPRSYGMRWSWAICLIRHLPLRRARPAFTAVQEAKPTCTEDRRSRTSRQELAPIRARHAQPSTLVDLSPASHLGLNFILRKPRMAVHADQKNITQCFTEVSFGNSVFYSENCSLRIHQRI
jgi:hypothetical protein